MRIHIFHKLNYSRPLVSEDDRKMGGQRARFGRKKGEVSCSSPARVFRRSFPLTERLEQGNIKDNKDTP